MEDLKISDLEHREKPRKNKITFDFLHNVLTLLIRVLELHVDAFVFIQFVLNLFVRLFFSDN